MLSMWLSHPRFGTSSGGKKSWKKCTPKNSIPQKLSTHLGVSENRGTPKSSILIGFSIIFTIHFGVPPLTETPISHKINNGNMENTHIFKQIPNKHQQKNHNFYHSRNLSTATKTCLRCRHFDALQINTCGSLVGLHNHHHGGKGFLLMTEENEKKLCAFFLPYIQSGACQKTGSKWVKHGKTYINVFFKGSLLTFKGTLFTLEQAGPNIWSAKEVEGASIVDGRNPQQPLGMVLKPW